MDIVATLPKQRFRDDDAIAGYAREPAFAGGADGFFAAVVGFLRQVGPGGRDHITEYVHGLPIRWRSLFIKRMPPAKSDCLFFSLPKKKMSGEGGHPIQCYPI